MDEAFDPGLRRWLSAVAVVLGVCTLVGLVLLWPAGREVVDAGELGVSDTSYPATVVRVDQFECPGDEQDEATIVCVEMTFRLDGGPDEGDARTVELYDVGSQPELSVGDAIVVPYLASAQEEFRYSPQFERERGWPMLVLALLFAALVVVQGRLRGLSALAGLAASIGVIVVFVLPALIEGSAPVPVAVVAASAIAFLALYLAHGFSPLTTVALLGTLASLVLVASLSWVFTRATVLSGLGEEAQFIRAFGGDLDFSGLLLAGMILGALGALDDMTVTQASSVAELRVANPDYRFAELYRAGSRIGRDHVASTVNTLALAYAGASLPLLLVFVSSQQSAGRVLTSEIVATEVVRTLVGSIGLVASVPLTTALAARLVGGPRRSVGRLHERGDPFAE
ncbi:MAG: YibE/F family protein [Microthrixaceae bacterium]